MWVLLLIACGSTPTATPPSLPVAMPAARSPVDTKALDVAGRRQLDKGDVDDARRTFLKALAANPGDAQAHLGLAVAMARLRQQGRGCASGARLGAILDHLDQASTLDGHTLDAMATDPDLAPVRATLRYAVIAGAHPSNSGDLTRVLPGETFYEPTGDRKLHFAAAGAATIRTRRVDAGGRASLTEQPARWSVDDGVIVLVDGPLVTHLQATVEGGLRDGERLAWSDLPRECEP